MLKRNRGTLNSTSPNRRNFATLSRLAAASISIIACIAASLGVRAEQANAPTIQIMLLAIGTLHNGNEKELITAHESLTALTGTSATAFSWRDKRGQGIISGLASAFPPLQKRSEGIGVQDGAEMISAELTSLSQGGLSNVSPYDLGFVHAFSAATLDQILFVVAPLTDVRAFRAPQRSLPPSATSISLYRLGDLDIVVAGGHFKARDTTLQEFATKLVQKPQINWQSVGPSSLLFTSSVKKSYFPPKLGIVSEAGRLENAAYEMAQLTVGRSASFATVAQLNYYAPGCCWDFEPEIVPEPNAFLVAYSRLDEAIVYDGFGHLGRAPAPENSPPN